MVKPGFVLFLCCYVKICVSQRRNVCQNFQDYPNIDISENCWYNPEMFSTPENIARNHEFQFQSHKIETEDGYHLTIFRIQDEFSDARKQPVLIHPGLFSSVAVFMTQGDKSLAFYLAKNSYDVWLANIVQDYPNIDVSENCWYNPDMFSTPKNIAHNHGFQFQSHKIETEDGYHLTVFRIQDKFSDARKQPILVFPGLFSSGVIYMTQAFYLAKNGYDVWLANHRGNTYSLGHSFLSTFDPKYWDFSFHEIGLYDVPAVAEYIANKTGNFTKIIYIGHSMGATEGFIYSSLKSDHAQQYLKGFIALGPATSMKYFQAIWKPFAPLIERFMQGLMDNNITVLFPDPINFSRIIMSNCQKIPFLCVIFVDFFLGHDDKGYDPVDLTVTMSYHPGRASLKCVSHYMQLIISKKFLQYDYGSSKNYKRYNSEVPPSYPLENVTIPVHMFYGLNDILTPPEDIFWVYSRLKTQEKSISLVPKDGKVKFNHLNFAMSRHSEIYFYKPLMERITHFEAMN